MTLRQWRRGTLRWPFRRFLSPPPGLPSIDVSDTNLGRPGKGEDKRRLPVSRSNAPANTMPQRNFAPPAAIPQVFEVLFDTVPLPAKRLLPECEFPGKFVKPGSSG